MEIKLIIFWVLLIAMAAPSFFFGFTKVVSRQDKVELFHRLGYPLWFMRLVGIGEIVTAIGLLLEPTRLLAIGLSAIILIGAVFSHIRAKEPKEAIPPSFVFVHLTAICIFTFYI